MKTICTDENTPLSADDSHHLYEQLDNMIITKPNEKNGYNVYLLSIENNIEGAYAKFLNILERIDVRKIPFSLGNKFHDILEMYPDKKLKEILSSNKRLSNAINTAK